MTIILLLAMTTSCQHNRARAADSSPDISELKTQNELLQQRSRFTTGSVVMIFGIVALLAFLAVNSRWTRRLELKNRQLQREHNIVVAKNKQLASLDCSYNSLKKLGVSKNKKLTYLDCQWNELTAKAKAKLVKWSKAEGHTLYI